MGFRRRRQERERGKCIGVPTIDPGCTHLPERSAQRIVTRNRRICQTRLALSIPHSSAPSIVLGIEKKPRAHLATKRTAAALHRALIAEHLMAHDTFSQTAYLVDFPALLTSQLATVLLSHLLLPRSRCNAQPLSLPSLASDIASCPFLVAWDSACQDFFHHQSKRISA